MASYLTFLRNQEMLLHTKGDYGRGPALGSIQDMGYTLEWWCAEWLRRAFASQGQIPVRHGVMLTELVKGGDTGDLDVVAFLDDTLLLVECKSSLLQIDPMTLNLFFWRVAQLEPYSFRLHHHFRVEPSPDTHQHRRYHQHHQKIHPQRGGTHIASQHQRPQPIHLIRQWIALRDHLQPGWHDGNGVDSIAGEEQRHGEHLPNPHEALACLDQAGNDERERGSSAHWRACSAWLNLHCTAREYSYPAVRQ